MFYLYLALESGNLEFEQTKFPVFLQNFQIPCVSLTGNSFGHFPSFPCVVGTLDIAILENR